MFTAVGGIRVIKQLAATMFAVIFMAAVSVVTAQGTGNTNNAALAAFKRGEAARNYNKAIAEYSEAIRLNPDYAAAYHGRGVAYAEKRDYERAIADFTQAIRLSPNPGAKVYYNRGLVYANKRDYARAISDFETYLRLDPNDADAKNMLASVRKKAGYSGGGSATQAPTPARPQATIVITAPAAPNPPPAPASAAPAAGNFLSRAEQDIFALVNQERKRLGLSPLKYSHEVEAFARRWSSNMSRLGYFDHVDPSGKKSFDYMKNEGVAMRAWRENIASRSSNSSDLGALLFDQWLNSRGHRLNMTATDIDQIGIGVYVNEQGKIFATQIFIKGR